MSRNQNLPKNSVIIPGIYSSQWDLVGGTPIIRIRCLSEQTGCEVLAKLEHLNPGGSIKDRAARSIIFEAEQSGLLRPGGVLVEGTAGNTGIGLALLGIPRGYQVILFMPNNQSEEKVNYLRSLGADVRLVAPCPFANPMHFYHQARQFATENEGVFWADQFENLNNQKAHLEGTGPEIWKQCGEKVDIFTCAAGTGGTIAGVSQYLKNKNPRIRIVLADPFGSGLFEYLRNGQFKAEGSSMTEGIGIMRLTANFAKAQIDEVIRISDDEMGAILFEVSEREGLFPGLSSALNLAAAFQLANRFKGTGQRILTVITDHGSRYSAKVAQLKGK